MTFDLFLVDAVISLGLVFTDSWCCLSCSFGLLVFPYVCHMTNWADTICWWRPLDAIKRTGRKLESRVLFLSNCSFHAQVWNFMFRIKCFCSFSSKDAAHCWIHPTWDSFSLVGLREHTGQGNFTDVFWWPYKIGVNWSFKCFTCMCLSRDDSYQEKNWICPLTMTLILLWNIIWNNKNNASYSPYSDGGWPGC